MSKPRVLQELQAKKAAVERESDMFADAFVEGSIKDLNGFIQVRVFNIMHSHVYLLCRLSLIKELIIIRST